MKKIFFLVLFWANFSLSQQMTVIDKDNKTAVEYATIQFYYKNNYVNGCYSDSNGLFSLPKNSDKLIISCVGYKTMIVESINSSTKLELEKNIYNLDEVIVGEKKYIAGTINMKKSQLVGLSMGLETGSYIENNFNKELKIKSFEFKVDKVKEDVKYKIHLYTFNKDRLVPDIELTTENKIYILNKNTKGLIKVDLQNENIILPTNGIYATLECLSGENVPDNKYSISKKEAIFSIEAHKSSKFEFVSRNTIKGVGWINHNEWLPKNYKITFGKDYDSGLLFVPSFGIDLIELE